MKATGSPILVPAAFLCCRSDVDWLPMGLEYLNLRHDPTTDVQNHTATVFLGDNVCKVTLQLPPVQHKHIVRFNLREAWLIVIWGERDVQLRGNLRVPDFEISIKREANFCVHKHKTLPIAWQLMKLPHLYGFKDHIWVMDYDEVKVDKYAHVGCTVM